MKILVCGDREWYKIATIREAIYTYSSGDPNTTIIHGACHGADMISEAIANELRMKVERYPAEWKKYGRAAGPIRNQQMIDEGKPDLVLAFHSDITKSKGTKDMIKRAKKAEIKVILITGREDEDIDNKR